MSLSTDTPPSRETGDKKTFNKKTFYKIVGVALSGIGCVVITHYWDAYDRARQPVPKITVLHAKGNGKEFFKWDSNGAAQLDYEDKVIPTPKPSRKIARTPRQKRARILFFLGYDALVKGDQQVALADTRESVVLDPQDAAALHNYGIALTNNGYDDAALIAFGQAVKKDPYSAAYRLDFAWELGRVAPGRPNARSLFSEGVDQAKAATRLAPDSDAAWQQLSGAQLLAGQLPQALISVNRALAINPDNEPALALNVVIISPTPQEAESRLKLLAQQDLESSFLFFSLAHTSALSGDYTTAYNALRRVVAMDPRMATIINYQDPVWGPLRQNPDFQSWANQAKTAVTR